MTHLIAPSQQGAFAHEAHLFTENPPEAAGLLALAVRGVSRRFYPLPVLLDVLSQGDKDFTVE
jgi:hypothetical protein